MLGDIPRWLWLSIVRSIGLAYLAFHAAWFLVPRSLAYELAVWQLGLITGGCGVLVSALGAVLFVSPRPWQLGAVMVAAALVGAGLGLGVAILIAQILFYGPLFPVWVALCWAAVGSLVIRSEWPVWLNSAIVLTIAGLGLAGAMLAFYRAPRQLFDAESWALTQGCVVPMLIGGTLLCYLAYLRYGR